MPRQSTYSYQILTTSDSHVLGSLITLWIQSASWGVLLTLLRCGVHTCYAYIFYTPGCSLHRARAEKFLTGCHPFCTSRLRASFLRCSAVLARPWGRPENCGFRNQAKNSERDWGIRNCTGWWWGIVQVNRRDKCYFLDVANFKLDSAKSNQHI